MDYFLYSCFEFEQTCKAIPGKSTGSQRWPETLSFLEGHQENFTKFGNFARQIEASLKWYTEQYPVLLTDRKVEMENIAAICAATVMFTLDLRIIAQADSPNTFEALQNTDQNSIWEAIDAAVESIIPNFSYYIKPYLRWVFVKKEEQTWDLGSRPPVGRHAPGAARRHSRGNSDSRGGSGNRRSGPPTGGPRSQGNRKDFGKESRDGRNRGSEDRNASSKRGPQRNGHAEQEKVALDAVRTAVEKLRQEPSLGEVRLNPSNSFFRRLQHKMAVAEGFYSFSTGEGPQRSVVVTRERPEHEDVP